MAIFAAAGTKVFIGGMLTPFPEISTADFLSRPWIQIGKVSSIGTVGDSANIIESTHLDSRRVEKMKGVRNAGDLELAMSLDPTDQGQLGLVSAELSAFHYAFKIAFSDLDVSSRYFTALVTSVGEAAPGANEIATFTATLAISSAILRVSI